jgi:D-beta-D-heptose 7-phosphate kinase/D-beta-D-heptose 1-phosphate adenosyltransferase
MLAALVMVDVVVLFSERTPLELIKTLRPDVLVKGGDWKTADMVGGPEVLSWGGEVRSLLLAQGYSTTSLIERVARAYGRGA